jgi:hypothetical protein
MKRIFLIASPILISIILISCSKGSEPMQPQTVLTIENTPSAKSSDNRKSSGVYKGTLLGSSGTFKLIIDSENIYGLLEVDFETYILKTNDISSSDLGKQISNALFTDAANKVNVYFSVEADGSHPMVSITIEGHSDVQAVVLKETSNQLVKVYEGYYAFNDTISKVHTIADMNMILLSGDTIGRAAYRVTKEVPIVPRASHDTPSNWDDTIAYFIEQTSGINRILVYRHLNTQNGSQFLFYFYDPFLSSQKATITDSEIVFKVNRTYQGVYSFYDSARLTRKL